MEAFEELYCRVTALELLVFAMAHQLDPKAFARDLAAQQEKLFATATFAALSSEVAERMTLNIERYARVILGTRAGKA
ncbi:MAG: hypothetical protein ABSH23_07490 [Steroidobacteraceae bacterium]|jgi:hypothetical protein